MPHASLNIKQLTAGTHFLFVLFIFCLSFQAHSQGHLISPLSVGDPLPTIPITLHQGDSVIHTTTSAFRGKVIIFDFWTVFCVPCIEYMPEMDSLQQRLNDKLQVILVTPNKPTAVERMWTLFKNTKLEKNLSAIKALPLVINDSVFIKLFPASAGVPMHVWIDTNGIFKYCSYPTTTTERNIAAFWKGEPVELDPYHQIEINTYHLSSWVDQRIGFTDHLLSYHFFSKFDEHTERTGNRVLVVKDTSGKRIVDINLLNKSATELYKMAYFRDTGSITQRYNQLLVTTVKDKTRFDEPSFESSKHWKWEEENKYCYVSKLTQTSHSDIFALLTADLDDFFNLHSELKYQYVKSYVLIKKGLTKTIHSSGSNTGANVVFDAKTNSDRLVIHNLPVNLLFGQIYADYIRGKMNVAVFNHTGINYNIDIDIPWGDNNYSISSLRRSLNSIGLDLVERYEKVAVVVIHDKAP